MERHVLKNGLTIYLDEDLDKHSAYCSLIVKCGGFTEGFKSNDETFLVEPGIAHLIEHYVIDNSYYGNLLKVMSEHFAEMNGGTGEVYTYYYFDTVENFNKLVEILLYGINNPVYNEEALNKTKKPVLR